jgi:predicted acetyltransferase
MKIPYWNKDLIVRTATEEDLHDARHVGTRAFGCNALDWFAPDRTLIGLDATGKIVAALDMNQERLWWGSVQIPGCAVGGVSTHPDEQRKGHAGALVVAAVNIMREHKWHASALWPFSFVYYRKFGWELTGHDLQVHAWPDILRTIDTPDCGARAFKPEDLSAVARLYEQTAQQTNCQTVRPDAWWQERVKSWWQERDAAEPVSRGLVVPADGGDLDGFAFWNEHGRPRGQGVRIDVCEFQARTVAAMRALCRALADVPNAVEISLTLPSDSLVPDFFPERCGFEVAKRGMVRITDPAGALARLRPPAWVRGTVGFDVYDWIINEERPVQVRAEMADGVVAVGGPPVEHAYRCDVAAFSRIFCGGLTVGRARMLGLLDGGTAEMDRLSDGLFCDRVPFRSPMELG